MNFILDKYKGKQKTPPVKMGFDLKFIGVY